VLKDDGLPLGLQVIGFRDQDAELFSAADMILTLLQD
jgi:Asp-tRNA(Asn)/Glu-tRNA(Gln) amidotransferase A subunit family amidase